MKKKILSMMLVAAMTVGTLAGCGSNSGNGNSEKGTDTTADARGYYPVYAYAGRAGKTGCNCKTD